METKNQGQTPLAEHLDAVEKAMAALSKRNSALEETVATLQQTVRQFIAPGPCTYVVRSKDEVKIGRTERLSKRLESLRTARPDLVLELVIHEDVEAILHRQFADKCIGREWFSLTVSEITDYLRSAAILYSPAAMFDDAAREADGGAGCPPKPQTPPRSRPGLRLSDSGPSILLPHPTITKAGRLIIESGYDEATSLCAEFPELEPYLTNVGDTRNDACIALCRLQSALPRFWYGNAAQEVQHCLLIAQIAQLLAHPGIRVQCPAVAISGPAMSGKTTRGQVPHVVVFGVPAPAVQLPARPRDLTARLVRYMSAGYRAGPDMNYRFEPRTVLLDSWDEVDYSTIKAMKAYYAALTVVGEDVEAQIPGAFIGEGSMLSVHTSRVPDYMSHPYELPDGGRFNETLERLARPEVRGQIISDVLTVLRAHILDGQDDTAYFEPFPGFPRWDRYIRRAIMWVSGVDVTKL